MAACMGTPPQPPSLPLSSQAADAESHYKSLLEYFKNLMWLTGLMLALIIAVGGFFFWTNLRDVRQDAKEQARQVATAEAEKGVKQAFDEKNVNELIQKVAREKINAVTDSMIEQKVGPIVDKVIEQQLNPKLRPLQEKMLLIGHISELQILIHRGDRPSLDELIKTMDETHDADVRRFAAGTLDSVRTSYEKAHEHETRELSLPGVDPFSFLQSSSGPSTLGHVVYVIHTGSEIDGVASATIIFRQVTGEKSIKMFDFKAVDRWCASHEPRCKLVPAPQAPAPK